jgi:hypothetical protein
MIARKRKRAATDYRPAIAPARQATCPAARGIGGSRKKFTTYNKTDKDFNASFSSVFRLSCFWEFLSERSARVPQRILYHVLGVARRGGVGNAIGHEKCQGGYLALSLFWPLTYLPWTTGHRVPDFLVAPCQLPAPAKGQGQRGGRGPGRGGGGAG